MAPADGATDLNPSILDASIQASEARTDTKFATALGEVRMEFARIEERFARVDERFANVDRKLEDIRSGQRSTFWGLTGLIGVVAALVVASLSFGSQMFGQGFSASVIADQAAAKAIAASRLKP